MTEYKSIPFLHIKIFICIFVVLLLYILSGAIYEDMPHGYTSSMLRFGSSCIAALLGGMLINQQGKLDVVCKVLPWFSILMTISVAVYGYTGASMVKDDEFGWNYQSISYCMADCFLFNSFYLFFYDADKKNLLHKIITLIVSISIIANIFLCLNGGGRGASLLLVFSIMFVTYKSILSGNTKKMYFIFSVIIVVIALYYLSNSLSLWDSDGFYRATHMLESDTEERENSYTDAIEYWMQSPLWGYGIGSIWHTVGFYSHNIFCDILAEGGLVFFLFSSFLIYKVFNIIIISARFNSNYYFILFYAFSGFGMLLFSGYWFVCEPVWFTLGAALTAFEKH